MIVVAAASIIIMIKPELKKTFNMMTLTSSAFADGGIIPERYSPFGADINPPLSWSDAPAGVRSFALIMEDPDVPASAGVKVWDHWIVFNIPPAVTSIPEAWKVVGTKGTGTGGGTDYSGPRPPDREHRYYFYIYALDQELSLPEGAGKSAVMSAMNGHVLAQASLMGRFAPRR